MHMDMHVMEPEEKNIQSNLGILGERIENLTKAVETILSENKDHNNRQQQFDRHIDQVKVTMEVTNQKLAEVLVTFKNYADRHDKVMEELRARLTIVEQKQFLHDSREEGARQEREDHNKQRYAFNQKMKVIWSIIAAVFTVAGGIISVWKTIHG